MIIDRICNYRAYIDVVPLLEEGIEFALSLADQPEGRYSCGPVWAMVQEGKTLPMKEGNYEAHRKYIDVQIVLKGEETVGWETISALRESIPYSEDEDIAFYEGEGIPVRITEGMFYLVQPHDAHKPCRHMDQPGSYRKIVLKIPVMQNKV